MKRVIVAGCGHGGLSAAATLAKNGYDVTVIEKRERNDLGYDWHDSMRRNTFTRAELPMPEERYFSPMERKNYSNPNKSVRLMLPKPKGNNIVYIDRIYLINHLIDYAEKCGVKFIFGGETISAVYSKEKVTGIRFCENGCVKTEYADLVIDAAGFNSPVRKSLPPHFGIQKEISYENVFCVWRGYFESTGENDDEEFNIVFYHCKRAGMDWAIRKKGYYDIMIGSFGTLGEDDVKEALSDFYEMYPDMTNKLIRGGSFGKIPLGKTLPVFVFNGYAAVGDSAVMTEPLSGSGLDMSIKAGKMLADTVIASGGEATRENLWKYNYSFFKEEAEKYYGDAMIKSFLSAVSADDIDFFFEKKIMTEKEVSNGGKTKYSAMELLQKASVLKRPGLLLPLAGVLLKLKASSDSKKLIPEEYNEGGIEKFKEIYSRF